MFIFTLPSHLGLFSSFLFLILARQAPSHFFFVVVVVVVVVPSHLRPT